MEVRAMKYLFSRVWGDDEFRDSMLSVCVVPLTETYQEWLCSLAENVAHFSDDVPDVASVKFHDSDPLWFGDAFPWNTLAPFEDRLDDNGEDYNPEDSKSAPGVIQQSPTEVGVMENGWDILDLPDDFEFPPSTAFCSRMVIFKGGHEVSWVTYPKHDSQMHEAYVVPVKAIREGQCRQRTLLEVREMPLGIIDPTTATVVGTIRPEADCSCARQGILFGLARDFLSRIKSSSVSIGFGEPPKGKGTPVLCSIEIGAELQRGMEKWVDGFCRGFLYRQA